MRLCHACHAQCRGVIRDQTGPSAPPSPMSATPATQNEGGCEIAPRLPRETKVDVRSCHACHAKCHGVIRDQTGPSAPPSPMSATPATQNESGCEIVPRLPRETKVDVTWQAWRNLTSAFVLRGRRGTHGTGWRAWAGLVADDAAALCVAGVAQSHIHLRFAWLSTISHPPSFCVAGVALMGLGGAHECHACHAKRRRM